MLWFDESYSLLRISGHHEAAFYALFDGKVHSSDQLLALEHVTPELGLGATLASLREEPQRGPLYYVLGRLWIGWAGNATAAVRGLSVLLGCAGIGLAFLVGRRLTSGPAGGYVLAAVTALSPLELRFSQQVREYVLVADLTLLSVWLLLRALERPGARRWCALGACFGAGLYTNVTFAFVIASEGFVALWFARRERNRASATGLLGAAFGAAVLYAPWAYASARAAARHSIDIAWAAGAYSPRATALKWAFNTGAVFFDAEYAHVRWGVVLAPVLALVAAALAYACLARSDARARTVVLAVTFSTLVPIVALDLLRHAHYELVARYLMPTWIGISMLVTLPIVAGLRSQARLVRVCASGTFVAVLAAGAFSALFDRTYAEWWDNNDHLSESAVGDIVRGGAQPALVVASSNEDDAYDSFVLGRYLPPATSMLLFGRDLPSLPRGYAVTYFFTPTQGELERAARNGGIPPRNVSPSFGLTVPDLNAGRAAASETVRAGNALWETVPETALRTRQ